MWVKSFKIISSILEDLDKDDGKFHDIQIVNDAIYIDGEKMVDMNGSTIWCGKALSTKTLNCIFHNETPVHSKCKYCPAVTGGPVCDDCEFL